MLLARWRLRRQLNTFTACFPFITELLKEFKEAEIYLVGGAIRNFLLGLPTKDYDFVVRNIPPQDLERFLSEHGQVDFVGRVFGVFKFTPIGLNESLEALDIALPRTEHALQHSGAYRDFSVQSNANLPIEEDLQRRDFTINAMAVNLANHNLVDPTGGLADLKNKVMRAVGQPQERLAEDFSRILRGIRLACQLDFQIEANTWQAMTKLIADEVLNKQIDAEWIVPRETIGKEIIKVFSIKPTRAFELFDSSGLFKSLIPEIEAMKNCPQPLPWHNEGDVFEHTKLTLTHLEGTKLWRQYFKDKRPSALTCIAALLHDIAKPTCLTTPEKDGADRIRFNEHEVEGGKMARQVAERLAFSTLPAGTDLHVDIDKLDWLISHHLLLLHADPETLRHTTVERYFFTEQNPGQELLELSLCDTGATIHADTKKPYLDSLDGMLKRIQEIAKLKAQEDRLPPPLLNGNEIMKLLGIPPGPKIGEVLNQLREEQLAGKLTTKEAAEKFVLGR